MLSTRLRNNNELIMMPEKDSETFTSNLLKVRQDLNVNGEESFFLIDETSELFDDFKPPANVFSLYKGQRNRILSNGSDDFVDLTNESKVIVRNRTTADQSSSPFNIEIDHTYIE